MAEIKTKPSAVSAEDFLDAVPDPVRRADGKAVAALMARVTGEQPQMWGPSIVGYGSYHYKYDSGHEGTMCRIGFSPRKAELVLYVLDGNGDQSDALAKLGKHRSGKGCLYIKKLADVDMDVLERLVRDKLARMDVAYPK
jgi:hypothetical protein